MIIGCIVALSVGLGFFNEYRKSFQSAGLAAVIEFTGNGLPEQNVAAALLSLKFERAAGPGRYSGVSKLADVPSVLLSECWNDYHAVAAKATNTGAGPRHQRRMQSGPPFSRRRSPNRPSPYATLAISTSIDSLADRESRFKANRNRDV